MRRAAPPPMRRRSVSIGILLALLGVALTAPPAAAQSGSARTSGLAVAARSQAWSAPAANRQASSLSTPPQSGQAIQDGGFELGPVTPWTSSSNGGRTLVGGSNPHTGSYAAHLCQSSNNCQDQVSQGIVVPTRVLSATLTLWFSVTGPNPTSVRCADYLAAGLVDSGGNGGSNSGFRFCEDYGGLGYSQTTIDETSFLDAHAGQTVYVVGKGVTDGSGPSSFRVDDYSLTIASADPTDNALPYSAVSNLQYRLQGSDGSNWQDIDATYLALTLTPTVDSNAIVSGNADLWTANNAVNQDLGIRVLGGIYPTATGQPEAWKESGGNAGTFSPNAAMVQTSLALLAGQSYTFKLRWKANHATSGTIFAGAGLGPIFSPTRLTVLLRPAVDATVAGSAARSQFRLDNSDGSTWTNLLPSQGSDIAPTLIYTPTAAGKAIVSGNVDLWTAKAGYNQDIGIVAHGGGASPGSGVYPTTAGQPEAWKESGGNAGIFSPNAAFVQTVLLLNPGQTYTFKLQWKTNRNASGASIFAGAGPITSLFSPTTLTLQFVPAPTNITSAVITGQPSLTGSDGYAWVDVDPALSLTFSTTGICVAVLGGNADLWTATATFNQDIGFQVKTTGAAWSPSAIGWKESGGFAGTFSPNAAFVQALFVTSPGVSYTARLQWKANKPSPASAIIFVGAGLSPNFSPTRLTLQLFCG
jgi:hypothetical protein